MGGPQDRRAPRIPIELPVQIVGSKSDPDLFTLDISRGGVFVKTNTPKPVRHLLRLRIDFAQGAEPIEVHGMVVHVTTAESAMQTGEVPGMGIEFIAFGGTPRERWENQLRQMSGAPSGTFGASGTTPNPIQPAHQSGTFSQSGTFPPNQVMSSSQPVHQGGAAPPARHTPIPAQHPQPQAQYSQPQAQYSQPQGQYTPPQAQYTPPQAQYTPPQAQYSPPPAQYAPPQAQTGKSPKKKLVRTVFPIPVPVVEQLYEIYEQELVAGEMFVCTQDMLNIGDRVAIRIIHPVNGNDYDLHGKVQQVHSNPQYPGLSVALRPSTLARREKFRAFIEEGLPEEEVVYDLIED